MTLHDPSDQPIFDTAIVVTDRVVLDRQLQNTIAQFEQTPGVVRKIDGTSRQLKAAIELGTAPKGGKRGTPAKGKAKGSGKSGKAGKAKPGKPKSGKGKRHGKKAA